VWQLIKPAVGHYIVGNPVIMKPAVTTSICALKVEEIMREAGIDEGDY